MNISNDLKKILLSVVKPGRYTGGEYGAVRKSNDKLLSVALSYPDLYEIGMSNVAVKVLYNLLNSLESVRCERVFAPAQDFEAVLRQKGLPLFSLESSKPLNQFDIIAFSLGYELTYTNMLNILDVGQIPYRRDARGKNDPIVIAGGPAVSNPYPLADFADFVFIGESEDFLKELFPLLGALKRKGAGKEAFMELLGSHPAVWNPADMKKSVKKAVYSGFAEHEGDTTFPVPGIRVIQDHGNVEIMRGCPNGCRFCHAGILYRPFRMKPWACIDREVRRLVYECGYREITLSSLSTGDYGSLDKLIENLNRKYKKAGVSFALPSLRINSLSLDILEKVSAVRKSGLTFAVETPEETWQLGINKEVSRQKIIELLRMAKTRGWRTAKFYFMIGLPVYDGDESEHILDFLSEIRKSSRFKFNINLSTFVPKPHTPFQWAAQIPEKTAMSRIQAVRNGLQGSGFRVGFHSPFTSVIEGLISRGDERVGAVIEKAFKLGARLDAWEEHFKPAIWRSVMDEDFVKEINGEKDPKAPLVWDSINVGVEKDYLAAEYEKALKPELTGPCAEKCPSYCGACGKEAKVADDPQVECVEEPGEEPVEKPEVVTRVLFSFAKLGRAAFLSHLNSMGIFQRAVIRAGYAAKFTAGFNPKPIIEFANPLTLGVDSEGEIVTMELLDFDNTESFLEKFTQALPGGYTVKQVKVLMPFVKGQKKVSLASIYWGAEYRVAFPADPAVIPDLFTKIMARGPSFFDEALAAFELRQDILFVRWKRIEKKGCKLIHFIEHITGESPLLAGYEIVRERLLAARGEQEPGDYFERVV